jgi:alpha-tubulin suppressor-like RCC1 family protein
MSRVRVLVVAVLAAAGILAVGPSAVRAEPPGVITWSMMWAGGNHTCGIRGDHSLWCWGSNSHGQLGLGDTVDRHSPVRVMPGTSWYNVRAGHRHTCAEQAEFALYCWGDNEFGQLGIGAALSTSVPARVPGRWLGVETSFFHTCGRREPAAPVGSADGEMWCWGWNGEGQLGTGDRVSWNVRQRVDAHMWSYAVTGYAHTPVVSARARPCTAGAGATMASLVSGTMWTG